MNKRKTSRIKLDYEISLSINKRKIIIGNIKNISIGGAFLQIDSINAAEITREDIGSAATLSIIFENPKSNKKMHGKIIRVLGNEKNQTIAVEFEAVL